MKFGAPMPFAEAVKQLAARKVLPTELSSAELRAIDAGLRRQSFFSARTVLEDYLEEAKQAVMSILNPEQVLREGATQTVTEGFNPATARQHLKEVLDGLGYFPGRDEIGTIKDLSSDARINLVVKTNVELSQGAGSFVRQNADADVVDLWPALELVRYEEKKEPRDWPMRWRIAAQVAGDPMAVAALELHGRMAALKSSGIWQALGDGAGGFEDTLGNPYPPFAFASGMWTDEVSREEAVAMGLIGEDETARPAVFDLGSLFST